MLGRAMAGAAGVLLLGFGWEGYKAAAPDDGLVLGGVRVLPRTTDAAMPHLWDLAASAGEPVSSAAGAPPLWLVTLRGAGSSLVLATAGWVCGVLVGLLLAVVMARLARARAVLLPWVVLSQVVPLIAVAPLVARPDSADGQPWVPVVAIASYLAFFPVSIGALRGFTAPDDDRGGLYVDLFRSFGVGWWSGFWRLRLPASVPYLLPALRLAAANAVAGTIVAEVYTGLPGGLGRLIVDFGASAAADPARQWSPLLGAILVGLATTLVLAGAATGLRRYRPGEAR
ncbi:ABC transporter permease [Promicromonospora sp. AC04]|uniref:ABC transporter permease n=1 Tax=Promicromonospora sp. AC04 TaxID=2135723 RepID=UPI001E5EDB9A|nr:ABC transporter permease subunit [Promicromonospora sp. AC04]